MFNKIKQFQCQAIDLIVETAERSTCTGFLAISLKRITIQYTADLNITINVKLFNHNTKELKLRQNYLKLSLGKIFTVTV